MHNVEPTRTTKTDRVKVDRRPRSTPHSLPEADAASYIGMSRSFLRQGRQYNRGPAYIRVGRTIRYRLTDLDAFLQQHRVEPHGPEAR